MAEMPEIKHLDTLLGNYYQKTIKIVNQSAKMLTAPGENYGSVMLALDLTVKKEKEDKTNLQLVAKLLPPNEVLCELFHIQITFKKELYVYTQVVPTLAEIEDEYCIKNGRASDLFARCFGGRPNLRSAADQVDSDAVMLFENLKILGYENGDRLIGFDYDSTAFIMRNLARFHAIPIALKLLKPEVYREKVFAILSANQEGFNIDMRKTEGLITGLKEILMVRPELEVHIDKMLADLKRKYETDFFKSISMDEPFSTFVHSDFWVNNMMLLYDENHTPVSFKIVDFQTPQNQSAVLDLLFFLYSSTSASVLYEHVDEFIKMYHDSFVECLKEFNVNLDNYSWDKFIEEIHKRALGILSQTVVMYKYILLERGNIGDMSDYNEDDLFSLEHVSDDCKKRMVKTFVSFVEHGWIL